MVVMTPSVRADPPPSDPPRRAPPPTAIVATARRTPRRVVVDGVLSPGEWDEAVETGAFVQRRPDPGATATFRATARVLYDDEALYVAVVCASRGAVEARLAQRDALPRGDWVRVMVDTRGEGITAFGFEVSPAGVQADGLVTGDGDVDYAWDAVWTAETRITAGGWSVELAIPWRVLRFSETQPTRRIQVERYDIATGETTALVPIVPDAPRYVSRFANLAGIAGLTTRLPIELRPYVTGRWRAARDPARTDLTGALSATAGADLKLGLTTDLVLDASFNPDFGNVAVDPAVLNLTTFEPFFPERRPFFLEGVDIFRTPLQLLHTRRIGAAPDPPAPSREGADVIGVDPATTIWGAVKLTGRIGRVSVGLLDALTGPSTALERHTDRDGNTREEERSFGVWTNWLAARARATVAPGSTVGLLATHIARAERPHDVVAAVDWDLRSPDGVHQLAGQVAASRAWTEGDGARTGWAAYFSAARTEDTSWRWSVRARAYGRDFDPNGLGYLDRADLVRLSGDMTWLLPRPRGVLRSAYVAPTFYWSVNTRGVPIDRGAYLEGGFTGTNFWYVGGGAGFDFPLYDDRETRGAIDYFLPWAPYAWGWMGTDGRAPVSFRMDAEISGQNGGWRTEGTAALSVQPASSLALTLSTGVRTVTAVPRWVATVPEGTTRRVVFGVQGAKIYDVTLRVGWALTRTLSLNVYGQLLLGEVRYGRYLELVSPELLVPYDYSGNAGFDRQALTVNAIARWEFRPGSTVGLVYLHRQGRAPGTGDETFGRGLAALGSIPPDDLLLVRLTYLIM